MMHPQDQLAARGWYLTPWGPMRETGTHGRVYRKFAPTPGHWFDSADWEASSFVALVERTELYIAVVQAVEPGSGALNRLLSYADAQGWRVKVATPNDTMAEILVGKGFLPSLEKYNEGPHVEIWTAP